MKLHMRSLACLLSASFSTTACGDDDHTNHQSSAGDSTGEYGTVGESSTGESSSDTLDSSGTAETEGEATLLDVELRFAVRIGDEDVSCGQQYADIGAASTTIEFLDIRFFVSNVRLVDASGAEVELQMEDDGEWQLQGSALLDFEDGSAGCSENTTTETNTAVRGAVPNGTYVGVRFDVGLPFSQNHLNSDETEPPLNTTAMFWNWASGYKFMKIDIANDLEPPNNRWNFHLGSVGCDNGEAGPTVPPDSECSRPGRPAVDLADFDPFADVIVLDVVALYEGVDVTADTPMSAPGCMSFLPDANECIDLFANLGLAWETGACMDGCVGQTVFRSGSQRLGCEHHSIDSMRQ